MATVTTQTTREFTDLDLSFLMHPVKKDVNKLKNEQAIIASIKNLLMTNHYERPFQPDLGSNIRKLLFENLDKITSSSLEREITQTIKNFEPRVDVKSIVATPDYDNNGFSVKMVFTLINLSSPITIQFFLERVR